MPPARASSRPQHRAMKRTRSHEIRTGSSGISARQRPASASRVTRKRPAAAPLLSKVSKPPAREAAGLTRKRRLLPTTASENKIRSRDVHPSESAEDCFEETRQSKLRKLGLHHTTLFKNELAATNTCRLGVHYVDQDDWGCSAGGRDDCVRLEVALEYGDFEMPALRRWTTRNKVAKPPRSASSCAGYPREGRQKWSTGVRASTFKDMLNDIDVVTDDIDATLDCHNNFLVELGLERTLGKLHNMYDSFRSAGQKAIADLKSWRQSDNARVNDFVLTCMPESQEGGSVSVHCVTLAGEDFATLSVPAGEDPLGPWLLKRLKTLASDRPGRLRLADAQGQLFAMDVKSPTCLRQHQLSRDLISFDDCWCDDCDRRFEIGDMVDGCRRCDYDLCAECYKMQAERANLRIRTQTSFRELTYGHIWGHDDPVHDRSDYMAKLKKTKNASEQHRLRQLLREMKEWSYSDSMCDREATTIFYVHIGDSKRAAAKLSLSQRVHRQCQCFNPFVRNIEL